MERMALAVINGKARYLHMSVEVLFDVYDKYGSVEKALEIMQPDTKEAFEVLCFLAVEMANSAELYRRSAGYDHSPFIEEKDISIHMSPATYMALKESVCQAITMGFKQEQTSEDEEQDLGLAELRKKENAGT